MIPHLARMRKRRYSSRHSEPFIDCSQAPCLEHDEIQEAFFCGQCFAWLCPVCEMEKGPDNIKECCLESIMAWLISFPFGANK